MGFPKFRRLGSALGLLAVAGCGDTSAPGGFDGAPIARACDEQAGGAFQGVGTQAELDFYRALWTSNRLEQYRFRLTVTCFCFPPPSATYLVVDRGELIDGFDAETGELADIRLFLSVEELFERIQAAIDADVDILRVQYHESIGHPMTIFVDPEVGIADDEIHYDACGVVQGF